MNTLSLRVRYRPVRLGFCIEKGNIDDLQQALQLTHALWGGRFNPLIPVGTAQDDALLAESLIDVFQVDTLYPIRETDAIKGLIEKFSYLMRPTFDRVLFSRGVRGNIAEFLDICHPTRTIFEEHIKDKTEPRVSITLYEWSADNPLRHVFPSPLRSISPLSTDPQNSDQTLSVRLSAPRFGTGGMSSLDGYTSRSTPY